MRGDQWTCDRLSPPPDPTRPDPTKGASPCAATSGPDTANDPLKGALHARHRGPKRQSLGVDAADRTSERRQAADGAAHRDNQCRGMVIGGGPRQDHDDSLAQAHTALGQAEGLASPFLRCRADESGVGGQLVGSEQGRRRTGSAAKGRGRDARRTGRGRRRSATASGPMNRSRTGGATKRLNTIAPAVSPQGLRRQDHPDGERAPAEGPGERGDDAFGRVVERREPAEQHRGAQDPVGEDQAGPGDDAGQPALSVPCGGPRPAGRAVTGPRPWTMSAEAAKVAASMTSEGLVPKKPTIVAAGREPDDLRELERGERHRGAEHVPARRRARRGRRPRAPR